ncbi:MAG: glutamate--tRNA ligase, partial [Acidobacteriota bacterium]
LVAKQSEGSFILRIEDTDRTRYIPEAIEVIYKSLRLAGMDYDEGPEKDGGFGPYVQSERLHIYPKYIEELIDRDGAYYCFCKKEEAAEGDPSEKPVEKPMDPCRSLSLKEARARKEAGEPYVVRQKIPRQGVTSYNDHVFGYVEFLNQTLEDQILMKSDGYPTYNFANVIDDHLMGITHVIRGVEYLSSTPKYNLLYKSFGWDIPEYVHLPHIVKDTGGKFSKRDNDASFFDLIQRGYLPEAVINCIALLGWNPGDDRELFTLPQLVSEFSVDRISKSNAAFSLEKLDWLNGMHIRNMDDEAFDRIASSHYPPELAGSFDTKPLSAMLKPRITRLTEIPNVVGFITNLPDYDVALFVHKKSKSTVESAQSVLSSVSAVLEGCEWSNDTLFAALSEFAASGGMKPATVLWAVRVAITGSLVSPGGATEIAALLGKEETLKRIDIAVKKIAAHV